MSRPRDSDATKERLLAAAQSEFAQYGLAGGRVDRIAVAAQANKQLIYAYFGSKEGLFDATMARRLGIIVDAVPLAPDDLPGYAAALADRLAEEPALARLALWKRLERPEAQGAETASYKRKMAAVRRARPRAGPMADVDPADVLSIVLAIATSAPLPSALAPSRRGEPGTARRRAAYRSAVRAAVAVLLSDPGR